MIVPGDILPGGAIAPSVPASFPVDGAQLSRYSPRCGHKISRYEIVADAAGPAESEPAVLLVCPACQTVSYRLPRSFYASNILTPVVIG